MQILRSLAPVVCALALALPVTAQDDVRLLGRVVEDPSVAPIADVHIVARNRGGGFLGQTVTDEDGRFELTVSTRGGGVRLTAARFGYVRTRTPFLFFDNHDFFRLEIRLDQNAVLLAPLEVLARSGVGTSPMLDNFRHRMDNGFGQYITRADILERRPTLVSDLLRTVPGINMAPGGSGQRSVVLGRRDCPMQVFVDGMLLTTTANEFTVDEVVSPLDVEGIEVYRGLGTVPAEFLNEGAKCGVVAIWTHRGGPG